MQIFMKTFEWAKIRTGIAGRLRAIAQSRLLKAGEVRARKVSGRNGRRLVEHGGDVADADDADQAVIVDHRQMPDVVLVHEVASVLQRVARRAGHQLLHRNELRYP